jgi:hypothetical protein
VDTQFHNGEYGHQSSSQNWLFPGMTLRDYFAAQALKGLLSGAPPYVHNDGILYASGAADGRAQAAYREADAMLKARGT